MNQEYWADGSRIGEEVNMWGCWDSCMNCWSEQIVEGGAERVMGSLGAHDGAPMGNLAVGVGMWGIFGVLKKQLVSLPRSICCFSSPLMA